MTAEADLGNDFKLQVGGGGSPETFTDFCAVFDVGELGEEKPLIDISTLCSNAREYRNGLADGMELPLAVNFTRGDTQIEGLYADYKADTVRTFRLIAKDAPQDYFEFSCTIRGWKFAAPVGDKARATFQLKITGEVIWIIQA